MALGQWRIALLVYAVQLGLALVWGTQVHAVLQASIGSSLELEKLLAGFDYTVLADFLNVHGASVTPLIGQLRWLAFVWLVVAVFLQAGMLYCAAAPGRVHGRDFWQGGAAYFFPFLKMAAVFLGMALAWSALVWLPAAMALMPALTRLPSELYAVWGGLSVLALWLLGLLVLFVWSVLGRLVVLRAGVSVWEGIRRGSRFFRRDWRRVSGLLFVFVGAEMALIWLYWQLESWAGMVSVGGIAAFFGLQQLLAYGRVWFRQALYAALGDIL